MREIKITITWHVCNRTKFRPEIFEQEVKARFEELEEHLKALFEVEINFDSIKFDVPSISGSMPERLFTYLQKALKGCDISVAMAQEE